MQYQDAGQQTFAEKALRLPKYMLLDSKPACIVLSSDKCSARCI